MSVTFKVTEKELIEVLTELNKHTLNELFLDCDEKEQIACLYMSFDREKVKFAFIGDYPYEFMYKIIRDLTSLSVQRLIAFNKIA